MPFAFYLPFDYNGMHIHKKPFLGAVKRKRYNTLDFHGKSCATKPTVSLDSSLKMSTHSSKKSGHGNSIFLQLFSFSPSPRQHHPLNLPQSSQLGG